MISQQWIPRLVIGAAIATILSVLWIYATHIVNIPYPDDYLLSLDFLLKFDNAHSLAERVDLLLERYESHIMLLLRLFSYLDWKIFGILSFTHIIVIAFFFLVITTVLLQSQCKGENRDLHAMTVMLLCINALCYGTTLLPNNSQLNYPVLALNASAFLLLSKYGYKHLWMAALMVTLATFSAGNGMFGFVAGALVLALQKQKKPLILWSVFSIVIIYLFFYVFQTHKDYKLATGLQLNIKGMVIYYVTFLGSIAQVIPFFGQRLAPLLGVVLLGTSFFLLVTKKYYQHNTFITAWIVFMLITAAVVTAGRGGNVFSNPLVPRYTINSCLLVALLYVAFVELYESRIKRTLAAVICLVAVLFNIAALLVSMPAISERKTRLTAAAHRYVENADNSGFVSIHRELDQSLLEQAEDRNIYHMAAAIGLKAPYKVPPAKILGVVLPVQE